jgi:hypothetical protein
MNARNPESQPATRSHCARCGRRLKSARSIARGYGTTCAARISAATRVIDVTAWQPTQVDSARELIEDAAIVAVNTRRSIFRSVASRGDAQYLTTPAGCNCPAGLRGRQCYHRAAVSILLAA